MVKLNCWEFKKCGREPGGNRTSELGICPASLEEGADGINFGKNGGRACWALAGTLCGDTVQGTFAQKLFNCMHCKFYKTVLKEEGKKFVQAMEILDRLKKVR